MVSCKGTTASAAEESWAAAILVRGPGWRATAVLIHGSVHPVAVSVGEGQVNDEEGSWRASKSSKGSCGHPSRRKEAVKQKRIMKEGGAGTASRRGSVEAAPLAMIM